MATDGYDYETKGYVRDLRDGQTYLGADGNAPRVPLGGILAWCKTFNSRDSGTTDSTSANKLADSGGDFVNDGIQVGDIVKNTTDTTWSYVTAVAATQLTLNDDIFVSGEGYNIYSTPYLSDAYVECNGQTLSDSDSPFNGATIPDLNASAGSNQRFLRGNTTSGTAGGADSVNLQHNHTVTVPAGGVLESGLVKGTPTTDNQLSTTQSILPKYYEVVWVMRIK